MSEGKDDSSVGQVAQLPPTHWSVVLAARDGPSSPAAVTALGSLCRTYWYPLYAHVRRRRHDHHAAQDLTQEFLARLVEKQWLESVAPEKGRFRSFLLAALDHFLANERRRGQALKRGGGQMVFSLEDTWRSERFVALEGRDRLRRSGGLPGGFCGVKQGRGEEQRAEDENHYGITNGQP